MNITFLNINNTLLRNVNLNMNNTVNIIQCYMSKNESSDIYYVNNSKSKYLVIHQNY